MEARARVFVAGIPTKHLFLFVLLVVRRIPRVVIISPWNEETLRIRVWIFRGTLNGLTLG
jgi:hypothetical protein